MAEQQAKKTKIGESKDKDAKAERIDEKDEKKDDVKGLDQSAEVKEEITLISQEKVEFKISRKAALQSNLVKTALDDDHEAKEVSLVHIAAPIVKKVVEYMNYHEDKAPRKIEAPLKSTNMKELVDRFDAAFVDDIDLDMLMRLLLAANYMDVKSLLELICAKVASMMKGKTAPQIRKAFNIREEFTPEEYEEIKEKFPQLLPIELEQKQEQKAEQKDQKSTTKQ